MPERPLWETFFGDPWPSGLCDVLEQGPTPVGELCAFCEEAIIDGDQGGWIGVLTGDGPNWRPSHRECQLRQVAGGLPHMQQRCSCFGGPGYTEADEGMSEREEALAVWDIFVRRSKAQMN